jgi:hypothetical protein
MEPPVSPATGPLRFSQRYLHPADRLNEILFGLIMVLTFTLAAGLTVEDGPDAGRQLLVAAIGCNLAWGIIDGAMYLMGCILDNSRRQRAIRAVRDATDEAVQLAAVRLRVDEVLDESVMARATDGAAALLRFVRDLALRASTVHRPLRRT